MTALGDLIVRMTMDTGGYAAGAQRASVLTAKLERDIENSMKRITTQAAAVGTVVANVAMRAATMAFEKVRGAIDAADELNAMSQKTGIAISQLQELQYAAILTDVPLQSLATGFKNLAKNAAEAAGGAKEQSQVFGAFNIKLRDTSGAVKSQMQLMEEWADIFRVLPDGPEKTALALKVFEALTSNCQRRHCQQR